MRISSLTALVLLSLAGQAALAQDHPAAATPAAPATPTAQLKIGDPAPALSIETWVKGEEVKGFEKGKVYVVEFWATWCGPCVVSMPHISQLQDEYKSRGVTFVGVTSVDPRNSLEKVKEFVKKKDADIRYTIAWDKGQETTKAYMEAAGQNGIPCAFVVDQKGSVAYIGHPMELDPLLPQILAGTFDPAKAARALEQQQARNEFMRAYAKALRTDPAKAYDLATRSYDAILHDDAESLNSVAWLMVDPDRKVEKKDLDLALKAATRANELTGFKDSATLDTLARVHFTRGEVDKAIELQEKAVSLAGGQMKDELTKALVEYKDFKAARGN